VGGFPRSRTVCARHDRYAHIKRPVAHRCIGRFEDAINNCSVADVQSAAGTEWQAPGFSARLLYSIPTPRPDDVTPLPANIDNPTHDPVGIVGCVAEVDRGRTRGIGRKNGVALLGVRFRNLSSEPIDQIVFRVWYLSPEKSLDAGPLQLCGIDDFCCQVAFSGDGYPDDR
jgi:hypothetical protein